MPDPITPALTAGEWARGTCQRGGDNDAHLGIRPDGGIGATSSHRGVVIRTEDRHAVAALALHGQPFGFTWEDVDDETDAARYWEGEVETIEAGDRHYQRAESPDTQQLRDRSARHRARAARIAALLPPRQG